MSSNAPNGPSRSGGLNFREILNLVVGLAIVFGTPILVGQLYGFPPWKTLILSFSMPDKASNVPVVLVWIVGATLLLRDTGRRRSRLALIAIGTLLAIALFRAVFYIWLLGSGPHHKVHVFMGMAEVGASLLSAVCWGLVIAALINARGDSNEQQDSIVTTDDAGSGSSRLGILVVCAVLGAGLGFLLNMIADEVNASPFRAVVYVVGGCVVGAGFAAILNAMARPRR